MENLRLIHVLEHDLTGYEVDYRIHATKRMFQRNIHEDDIETVLNNGFVIERYEDDFPLPSLLVNGQTTNGRALHLVVGLNHSEKRLVIITAYEPDAERWVDNYTRRRQ